MMAGARPAIDARFDVAEFGLDDDLARGGFDACRQLLAHAPGTAAATAWWWLTGRRLRANQRLRAAIGDRLRRNGRLLHVSLEDGARPAPDFHIQRLGLDTAPGHGGQDAIVLITGEDCAVASNAPDWFRTLFALEPDIMAASCDGLVMRPDGGTVPLLANRFDADAFMAIAPIAPVVAFRQHVLETIGVPDPGLPGSELTDMLLRVAARFGAGAIGHVPEILVRWAMPPEVSGGEGARESIRAARLEVARRHLLRSGRDAELALDASGIVRIATRPPRQLPRVSVIIPTRDRVDLLQESVAGVLHRTDYPDIEVIIVDNGSVEAATRDYFDAIRDDGRVRILDAPGPFNFSALNNRAAQIARGDVLVLLNNDISIIEPDWLRRLVAEALRPDIGAVGAKLLYPGGLIQHAGIVLGLDGTAQHAHQFFPASHRGYMHRLAFSHRVSAVTAACLAVEKAKFDQVGGFDEAAFPVALNDVDLCLALEAKGYSSLIAADVVLIHHESATRPPPHAAGQSARWNREVAELARKWGERIDSDPFYSIQLGAASPDFSIPFIEVRAVDS